MPKRQFFRQERGSGHEDRYNLVRDPETGQVFVLHEWSHRVGDSYDVSSADYELETFLSQQGTPQHKLRELIGSLVND